MIGHVRLEDPEKGDDSIPIACNKESQGALLPVKQSAGTKKRIRSDIVSSSPLRVRLKGSRSGRLVLGEQWGAIFSHGTSTSPQSCAVRRVQLALLLVLRQSVAMLELLAAALSGHDLGGARLSEDLEAVISVH